MGSTTPLPLPIGIRIAPTPDLARPAAVEMAAGAAERLGYAAVWVIGDDPEELTAVATAAAAATDRVRVGVGLLVGPDGLRQAQRSALPAMRQLAPGRLTLGIVVPAGLSAAAAARVVDTVRSAGATEGAEPPRIVLSATSDDGLRLVAQRADGWLADGVTVAELPARWQALRAVADTHGRAADLALVVPAWVRLVDETLPADRADYHGDVRQVADDVLAAATVGAEAVVLMPTGEPTLDELLDVCARVAEALEVQLAGQPG
jgi:5,10-methylenetetrahydromethanopterin reductase